MKKVFLFLSLVLLISGQGFCADEPDNVIVREVKGQGVSRDEAIKKALYEAVSQVRGVKIASGDYSFGYRSASADIDRKDSGKKVEFDAVSVETGGTVLKTETDGLVKTYQVLNERKIDDSTYEVTLKVWVFKYEPADKSKRVKLAIMPIKTPAQYYRFGTYKALSTDISRQLSQKLSVGLTATNKFAVLDREYIFDFARERNILMSGDAPLEEQAKLGMVLGADYMLVGTISDARLEIKEKMSRAIGHKIYEYEADFVFDYRLLVGPTRQVKLAEVAGISLETDEVKKLVKDWDPKDLDFREMTDNLILKVARQVVATVMDRLYPIRIANIDENGQIIINQGGKRISKGLLLDVFVEGKEIFDVDTKESLGKTETLIAIVKIDKVAPAISYGRLVKGDLSKISDGLVCRPKGSAKKKEKGFKSNIKRTPRGGVKLPFD